MITTDRKLNNITSEVYTCCNFNIIESGYRNILISNEAIESGLIKKNLVINYNYSFKLSR